ncbi:syntaxin-51 [Quercus suber]
MATINSFRGKVPSDLKSEELSYVMNSIMYALGLMVSSTDSVGLRKRMKVLINGHAVDSVVASQVVLVPYVISKFYLLLHKYDLVSITIKFPKRRSMAASADSWVKEYNEAVKLADDINGMISERSSLPATGPDAQRHASSIRRKITILGTRLDSLQSLLSKIPGKQPITEKEMNRRKDNLANLRSKVNQMASTLNMSNFANRDSLIGPEIKPADAVSRTVGLDNSGLVGLQRQVMKEQDEDLEKLEVTVVSTKHIALAVNEELDLHTRLIDDLDQHVDVTDSRSMAASADSWVKEYNEAVKLADDINGMISERSSLPATGPDAQRHASSIRRKITILGTRLDSLQSLLSKIPGKQPITEKEMNRRKDNLANLRSKVNQMASTLNMSNFANRDSLIGPEIKPADAVSRTVGLDNSGLVGLQRQVMKEQDEDLEKLEVTVVSTKHIALAVNEELDLHTRLIDDLDQHVDVTDSRLRRVQKNLAILNKRTKGGCSCMCLLLSVIGIVVLVAVIYLLIKYL